MEISLRERENRDFIIFWSVFEEIRMIKILFWKLASILNPQICSRCLLRNSFCWIPECSIFHTKEFLCELSEDIEENKFKERKVWQSEDNDLEFWWFGPSTGKTENIDWSCKSLQNKISIKVCEESWWDRKRNLLKGGMRELMLVCF